MKVYNWSNLFITLLAMVVAIRTLGNMDGFEDLIFLVFLAYVILEGLFASLSKEGLEESRSKAARIKKVRCKLFGRFAPVAPYAPLLFFLLAWAVAMMLPTLKWLILLLILSAFTYMIWFSWTTRKHMKLEEEREKAQREVHL